MDQDQNLLELEMDDSSSNSLKEATKWGKLFAMLCIIGFSLVFLVMLVAWNQLASAFAAIEDVGGSERANSQMLMIVFVVAFIIVGTILIVLMTFLIRGANNIHRGLRDRDQITFNNGLSNLKNFFSMYGVLSIMGTIFGILGLLRS